MIQRLTGPQRRIVAVVMLLIVVIAVVQVVLVPVWRTYFDNRDAISQNREDIRRFHRLAAKATALEETLERLDRSDALAQFILGQSSVALAAAALQERVKAVVTTSGGALTSTQVLQAEKAEGFKRITVNVRMAVSIDALQQVLYALESNLPYLIVDDVMILSRGRRKRRRVAPVADLLDVRFNLSGYMRDERVSG